MQHTIESQLVPPLLAALIGLLEAHRGAFRQERTYQRSQALLRGTLWCLGRHTLTPCLLSLGHTDADWSPFYRLFSRRRIAMATLHQQLFAHTLPHSSPAAPYLVAVDGFAVPHTSNRMPGVGWRQAPNTAPWRRGLSLAQRFGVLHWLPPLEHGFTRTISLISYP